MPSLDISHIVRGPDIPRCVDWERCDSLLYAAKAIQSRVDANPTGSITEMGLAVHLSKEANLELIALCAGDKVFVISSQEPQTKGKAKVANKLASANALALIFGGETFRLAGFDVHRLSSYITQRYDCRVVATNISPNDREFSPGCATKDFLSPTSNSFAINDIWDIDHDALAPGEETKLLVIRAWISARLAVNVQWRTRIGSEPPVDTRHLCQHDLSTVHRMVTEMDRIGFQKARTRAGEFDNISQSKEGDLVVQNARYASRIRQSSMTRIVLTDAKGKEHVAMGSRVQGRRTTLKGLQAVPSSVQSIRVLGREEGNNADVAQNNFILKLLQGKISLQAGDSVFLRQLWFPNEKYRVRKHVASVIPLSASGRPLNQSQANVVTAITASDPPVVVIHGPPGSGKTTTISIALRELERMGSSSYVVAQSNVGVKNIAESLYKQNVPFKLLVSKEFYEEWHEHMYKEVEHSLIRIDELPSTFNPAEMEIIFDGIRVVLCTLSALSNPALLDKRLFSLVRMQNLIIDEASQISIFNYLHLFFKFKDLKKVCFFGDPKQLPPFGKETAKTLQSVFDIKHLKASGYFLNTQYRMPIPLGNFISTEVYDGKLKSVHPVESSSCVKFVDVYNGTEESVGKTFKNISEAWTVRDLVAHYSKRGLRCCVITPYDAQRDRIQQVLKQNKLPWESVFNIDSFQGNEADIIIVSVVRTKEPGFLRSRARNNVMLTRCKKGMVIVGNKAFLRRYEVKQTLLGKLVTHWMDFKQPGMWCKWQDVRDGKASLPA